MNGPIHRDPVSAWRHLCDLGGIELDGRDEGLDQRIQNNLNPGAASFEDALSSATTDSFARAFFASLHPYVEMFRDILDFFEHADATKGESQWTIQVDQVDLDLEHFRHWLASWDSLAKTDVSVPAIDSKAVWNLLRTLQDRKPVGKEIQLSFRNDILDVADDVRAWVTAYDSDEYRALPQSLLPPNCPPQLSATASIAFAAIQRLLDLGLRPSTRKQLYDDHRVAGDPSDGLEFWTIAQNETDYWLRTFVVALSAAATSLDKSELDSLGSDLDEITGKFPLRPFQVDVSIGDLDSVLSLPIWKKRYDLYSVWIATEALRALIGHDIEIHHDNGRIAFAFKETLVAAIHSSSGPFRLISERRIPLENPQGKGRKEGVQPDHGLWTVELGEEVCKMAIEVKHYKSSSKAKFVDVFEDYARAVPDGDVYLVNHGPAGNAVYEVSRSVRDRCNAIGHLTSSNQEARREFGTAVRNCVGEPIVRCPTASQTSSGSAALLFDVSGSMTTRLQSDAMAAFAKSLAESELPSRLVAADTSIIGEWDTSESGLAELLRTRGGSTNLSDPVSELLNTYESVIVVTDSGGVSCLRELNVKGHESNDSAPSGINVCVCTRT